VTLAAAAKTIEGIAFTHVLKTGGTGSAAARSLSFAVTGPCTIEVYLISANATSERTLNIYAGSYGGTPLTTMTAATMAAKQTYSYTGGPTTIYLGSANSGINFYAVNLVYAGDTPSVPTYTLRYDENGRSRLLTGMAYPTGSDHATLLTRSVTDIREADSLVSFRLMDTADGIILSRKEEGGMRKEDRTGLYYDLHGRRIASPAPASISIVRFSDGTVKKVIR
jgi:hypothetical protein